jgi:WD40 repeat protein
LNHEQLIATVHDAGHYILHLLELENGDLVSACAGGIIKTFKIKTGEITKTIDTHQGRIECISLIENNQGNIACGHRNGTISVINLNTGLVVKSKCITSGYVLSLVTLSNHNLAGLYYDGWNNFKLTIWNFTDDQGEEVQIFEAKNALCLLALPNVQLVVGDPRMSIFDAKTGKVIKKLDPENARDRDVKCLLMLNETKIASGSYLKTIKIWDLVSGQVWRIFHLNKNVCNLSLFKNINYLLIRSEESIGPEIQIWNWQNDEIILSLKPSDIYSYSILTLKKSDFFVIAGIAEGSYNCQLLELWDVKF